MVLEDWKVTKEGEVIFLLFSSYGLKDWKVAKEGKVIFHLVSSYGLKEGEVCLLVFPSSWYPHRSERLEGYLPLASSCPSLSLFRLFI